MADTLPPAAAPPRAPTLTRRAALWLSARVMMAAGLVGGYGLFAWVGARFMLPARFGRMHQLFVTRVDDVAAGSTLLYQTPDGRTVNITRRGANGSAEDFIALSSTCPHLGCQVRWEGQNDRYFCPCHNGTFDAQGTSTGGPPFDAGLSLPRYLLTVEKGLLYINVPVEQLSIERRAGLVQITSPVGPGHDPCLTQSGGFGGPGGRRRETRVSSVREWIGERVPVSVEAVAAMSNEPVPNHLKRWWFALGGTPAYLFVVQIVTGILLAFYYQPSPTTAYESVRYITEDASFGWYLRSLHKWGATLMIAAVILHQMRVFFTGAYRRPRELNWMIGMTLLACTLLLGFTGYSLVFEQLSYWGATVGANISDTVPVVGPLIKQVMLGGEAYNDRTLSRFFILHAAVLPVTLILVLMMHIALVRLHGVTELEFESEAGRPAKPFNFFPDHFYTELIIGLTLMILLSALATLLPVGMGPRADPLVTPEIIKPEWFFYVAFRWLKLFSGVTAVLTQGFIVFVMFFWPFIDAWLVRRFRVRRHQRVDWRRGRADHHGLDDVGGARRALRGRRYDTRSETLGHRQPGAALPAVARRRAVPGGLASPAGDRRKPRLGDHPRGVSPVRRLPHTGLAGHRRPLDRSDARGKGRRLRRVPPGRARTPTPSTTTARRSRRSSRRGTAPAATH